MRIFLPNSVFAAAASRGGRLAALLAALIGSIAMPAPEAAAQNAEVQNAEVQNAEVQNAEVQNAEVQNAEVQNAEVQNAEVQNAEVQNAEVPNAEVQNAEVPNAGPQEAKAPEAAAPEAAAPEAAAPEAAAPEAADQNATVKPAATAEVNGGGKLRFSFEGTPWRDVINWLADESDLALHVQDLPTGSLSYSDPAEYTPDGAIDRVNLFLLSQGFTLVRSGKLLSVINLGDPRSVQQLDALAKLVTVDQLEQMNDQDVVKCIFPLGDIKAEDAVEELSALKLMTTPAVFNRTNRLMITDTAAKLKNAKVILDAFEPDKLDNGTVVKSFTLQYAEAEDVLTVARPHLGLATGEMIGIDVSLSADIQGKNIFVTGVEDKVKLIEGLVTAIDKPKKTLSSSDGVSELRSHAVEGGNVETIYNVLQTLLAGKPARLSMDETAGSIVALAAPEVQKEIEETVAQLQASDADFEVIPLKNVDPYLAVSLLEQMLDLPDPLLLDPEDIDPNAPKIDADPKNMRLFVRAKQHQIDQIKKIVAGLDVSAIETDDSVRVLPLKGKLALRVLETAARFWREANPIVLYPPAVETLTESSERVVAEPAVDTSNQLLPDAATSRPRFLTDHLNTSAPMIRCQVTGRGLLLQSDDSEALDRFQEHLRTIAGPADSIPAKPVVYYLKYTRPDDALRTLAELLDGGESTYRGEGGSLINGFVSNGSFMGSLVTSRQGTTTMTAGTISVVADSRLNRLIAQGTASDLELIENYLKIVDKDTSITDVETYGTSHVIELRHTQATEVAATLREAYSGRISGLPGGGDPRNQPSAAGQAGGQPRQPAPPAAKTVVAAKESGGPQEAAVDFGKQKPGARSGSNQPVRNLEPKMTIAVHEPSNSLIVTAPEQLFREVEQLVKLIDTRSEQVFEIVAPADNSVVDALMNFSGQQRRSANSNSGGRARATTPASSQRTARSAAPVGLPPAVRAKLGR